MKKSFLISVVPKPLLVYVELDDEIYDDVLEGAETLALDEFAYEGKVTSISPCNLEENLPLELQRQIDEFMFI